MFVKDAGAGHGDAAGTLAPGVGHGVVPVEDVHLDTDGLGCQFRGVRGAALAMSLLQLVGLPAVVSDHPDHRGQVHR